MAEEPTVDIMRCINDNVASVGWQMMVMEREEGKPAVVYTIGLYSALRHPDLLMIGMAHKDMMQVVGRLSQMANSGANRWKEGDLVNDLLSRDLPVTFVNVATPPSFMQTGMRYYECLGLKHWQSFPVLQVLWPDEQGAFPYEEQCSYEVKYLQPLVGRNPETVKNPWPFQESPWTRCIIGADIVRNRSTILYITRAVNGVWHFMEDAAYDPNSYSVNLVEVFRYDPSVRAAAHLQTGQRIMRHSQMDDWKPVSLSAQSSDEENSADEASE